MADFTVDDQGKLRPFQDLATVEKFLADLPDAYLYCRAGNRHHWAPSNAVENRRYKFWTITERCINCHQSRWCERSSKNWAITKDWIIDYVADYLAPRGSGAMSPEARNVVYREHVKRNFKTKSTTTATSNKPRGKVTLHLVEAV